jgi:phosphomannomutase
MAIPHLQAGGGLILTASHNPAGWNALKLLDERGEFLSPDALQTIQALRTSLTFPATEHPGYLETQERFFTHHIDLIVGHPRVQPEKIRQAQLSIVVDAINSGGALCLPLLLERLGVKNIHVLNGDPHGRFAHPPEPLPENLSDLAEAVRTSGAHLGIAVDPDVDRVAFFLPDGQPFGEEYSLVAIADYALQRQKGPVVTNQSTTQAVAWVARQHGVPFYESRVGEYHVVQKMKEVGAIIGGEGNGGIIWPALHYGRDALAGIALFLSFLAEVGGEAYALRHRYPTYCMVKARLPLTHSLAPSIWSHVAQNAEGAIVSFEDGLKLRWEDRWIHLRPSGTEPLLRLIVEAPTAEEAHKLLTTWQARLLHTLPHS